MSDDFATLPHTPTLTTTRLVLRPIILSDAVAVQQLFPVWEIVRYLQAGVPWPFPLDGAVDHILSTSEQRLLAKTIGVSGWRFPGKDRV
jgi:hypothetical protein